jgi:two-component system nitrogen regulation sensor histidine kinase GlnL
LANRDQLIQVFLNLVKNAAEAVADHADGEIHADDGVPARHPPSVPGTKSRVSLPLEFCVKDNGPGVPGGPAADPVRSVRHHQAERFGLGLALVAKIVGDHGGIIECESPAARTRASACSCPKKATAIARCGPTPPQDQDEDAGHASYLSPTTTPRSAPC